MRTGWKQLVIGVQILSLGAVAGATDVTIHLKGSQAISRSTVKYKCDAQGVKMGLPDGVFAVEYVNGAGNSLAIVPVGKDSKIFANVISGSGARYAAGEYVWWDAAGRGTTFSSDSLAGKMTSECQRVK